MLKTCQEEICKCIPCDIYTTVFACFVDTISVQDNWLTVMRTHLVTSYNCKACILWLYICETHKRLKERFLIGRNRRKHANI